MDDIIARAIRGEASPRELAELHAWRAASTENERHYQEATWVLEALRKVGSRERLPPPRATDLIARSEHRKERRRFRSRTRISWSVAAAAVLMFGVGHAIRSGPVSRPQVAELSSESAEVVTGDGELATVRMADGSVARLAPRSRLRLLPSPTERAVWIEGRVFFAAASNPDRPFRVRTRAGDMVALGTRFDVQTEAQGLQLAVIEGRVALIAGGARTEVATGETAGVHDGRTSAVAKIDHPEDVTGWMRRFLAFQSTPLASVAAEIERVYGRRIVLADSSLGSETVTATFTDESFDRVVRVVCTVVGVRCTPTANQVTISR